MHWPFSSFHLMVMAFAPGPGNPGLIFLRIYIFTWLLFGAVPPLGAGSVLVCDGAPGPVRPIVSVLRHDTVRVTAGFVDEGETAFLAGRRSSRRAGSFCTRAHGTWNKTEDQNKNLTLTLRAWAVWIFKITHQNEVPFLEKNDEETFLCVWYILKSLFNWAGRAQYGQSAHQARSSNTNAWKSMWGIHHVQAMKPGTNKEKGYPTFKPKADIRGGGTMRVQNGGGANPQSG